jgi:pyridinium-3,5-biscarboxylic acid mononucleotide sulfurtransferase
LEKKLDALRLWIRHCNSVLVAYSGGVDSALLMAVAHQVLGERALACIGVSPSYPKREMEMAVQLAQQLGSRILLVNTHEHMDTRYAANPVDRCYYCKNDLFDRLAEVAKKEGIQAILDGNNADDLGDDRPGRIAAQEHGVRSPLLELGITKNEVRAMAKTMGLPTWDKPAMACLSSRVPHGTLITPQVLHQIEAAEEVLAALGFRQYRVRHHDKIARIELPAEDLLRAVELRSSIVEGIRKTGYSFVCLDLAGFRAVTKP